MRRSSSEHAHVGCPCVTCALYDIFTALNTAYIDVRREAVAPTSLRIALSNLYPQSNFFQEVNSHASSLALLPFSTSCILSLAYLEELFGFKIVVTWSNVQGEMNDASEVLGVIFDCLHKSFDSDSCFSCAKSVTGAWDCTNNTCIAHSLFGMDVFERMNCYNCGLESRHMKYTTFFHNINASALRTMKVCYSGRILFTV